MKDQKAYLMIELFIKEPGRAALALPHPRTGSPTQAPELLSICCLSSPLFDGRPVPHTSSQANERINLEGAASLTERPHAQKATTFHQAPTVAPESQISYAFEGRWRTINQTGQYICKKAAAIVFVSLCTHPHRQPRHGNTKARD